MAGGLIRKDFDRIVPVRVTFLGAAPPPHLGGASVSTWPQHEPAPRNAVSQGAHVTLEMNARSVDTESQQAEHDHRQELVRISYRNNVGLIYRYAVSKTQLKVMIIITHQI